MGSPCVTLVVTAACTGGVWPQPCPTTGEKKKKTFMCPRTGRESLLSASELLCPEHRRKKPFTCPRTGGNIHLCAPELLCPSTGGKSPLPAPAVLAHRAQPLLPPLVPHLAVKPEPSASHANGKGWKRILWAPSAPGWLCLTLPCPGWALGAFLPRRIWAMIREELLDSAGGCPGPCGCPAVPLSLQHPSGQPCFRAKLPKALRTSTS